MASVRSRRRNAPLEFVSLPPRDAPHGFFSDLDPASESFAKDAAGRIARLEDLALVDDALSSVPRQWYRFVETLALQGIGLRIAQIGARENAPPIEAAAKLAERRAELAKIPEDLQSRVEAYVKTYWISRPWLHNKKDKARE